MTYDVRNLSVIAYANGFTLWHYGTDQPFDPNTTLNGASDLMRVGDIVLVSVTPDNPNAQRSCAIYGVTAVSEGKVEAGLMSAAMSPTSHTEVSG